MRDTKDATLSAQSLERGVLNASLVFAACQSQSGLSVRWRPAHGRSIGKLRKDRFVACHEDQERRGCLAQKLNEQGKFVHPALGRRASKAERSHSLGIALNIKLNTASRNPSNRFIERTCLRQAAHVER